MFEDAEEDEARVVFTRRSSGLRTHRGEVSFPGGRLEEGEEPTEAARYARRAKRSVSTRTW